MNAPEQRPRGLTFTLRVLFAAVAVVAVVVTWVNSYIQTERNNRLEIENRRLRDEVGELSIVDASRLHAVRVATDNRLLWAWRIWIPQGRNYRLRIARDRIPKNGFPPGGGTMTFTEPGEHFVRYRIQQDPANDGWYGTLSTRGGFQGRAVHDWMEWDSKASITDGAGATTEAFEPGERA